MERNSIASSVYGRLKERILNLEYKPGRSLSVATLAREFNVSRSPVREALLKLSDENLVEIFPQSGSRVSLINLHKTEEERFIRKSLEMAAIRDMYYSFSEMNLTQMSVCIQKQEEANRENDCVEMLFWDEAFHREIFKSINKEDCWRLAVDHSPNEHRVRLLAQQSVIQTNEKVIQNHKALVSALRNHNFSEVLDIENIHLNRILEEIVKLVRVYPEIFQVDSENPDKSGAPEKIRGIIKGNENFLRNLGKID